MPFKDVSRNIPTDVVKLLKHRSNDMCEVCGNDTSYDKHHIFHYSRRSELDDPKEIHNSNNLLVVCPTCHRQVDKYLNEDQQKELCKWHNNKVKPGKNSNPIPSSNNFEYIVGGDKFINTPVILNINGDNVILINKRGENRYYFNCILLEGFTHKLLILDNRLIYQDHEYKVEEGDTKLNISKDNNSIFSYEVINGIPRISFFLEYYNKKIQFDSKTSTTLINNNMLSGNTFSSSDIAIRLDYPKDTPFILTNEAYFQGLKII